ncbi:MAG: hypothetical protein HZA34_00915 [Candidatus Pacebacteria bacterium]|nr:hypothetical protein [Candidatus Paceibacterota bacterium]
MSNLENAIREHSENELFKDFAPARMKPLGTFTFESPWNNFHRFFYSERSTAREVPVWKRFVALFPDLAQELTTETIAAVERMKTTHDPQELPIEKLKKAYEIMSQLVSIHDPCAENEEYLIG